MDVMVENTDPKKQREVVQLLTGPLRTTTGSKFNPEDEGAPAWWHGDEEAFELGQLAQAMPKRRPRR